MPLFTTLAALSQTPASNPPDGSVDLPSTIDDQMRLLASFIAQLRDGAGFSSGALAPSGTVFDYAGTSVPSGYLACDGSAVSRATYSALFTAIGTTWGAGDGSTTFNVPDARGRTSIGAGTGTSLTARTVGTQNIGEETHALTTAELAAHNHTVTITDSGHIHTATDSGHTHGLAGGQTVRVLLPGTSGGANLAAAAAASTADITATDSGTAAITVNSHTTGITATTANNGSGTAHNNMQPSLVFNKIIKT